MNRFFSLILFFGLVVSAAPAQKGIQFADGSWTEILALAKKENKPVFVDAYTAWCSPCKMMTRNVFPEPAVGDFFNAKFINVKMNMEEGEGLALAQHYQVEAYPTLLFVDSDGEVLHRAVGFQNAPELLTLAKTALDPEHRLSSFQQRYAVGERAPQFLYEYAQVAQQAMDGQEQTLAEEYLRTQNDWSHPKNLRFIFNMVRNTDSGMFDYLLAHRAEFEELLGSQVVINRIQSLIMEEAFSSEEGPAALAKVDALFARAYPEAAAQLSGLFHMNYYQYTGDIDNYARATVHYFEQFPSDDPSELNNAAWEFYEMVDNKKMLEKAVAWAERSVLLDQQYFNTDTLAALYAKLGWRKKAIAAAERAIALARASGEDCSTTEALLAQLRGH